MRRIQSSFYLSERFSSVNRAETKPEVTFPDMRLFPPRGHVLLYETARARRASSSTSAPCGGAQGGRAGEARVAGCSHTAAKLLSATFCQCELRYSPRLCVISHAPDKQLTHDIHHPRGFHSVLEPGVPTGREKLADLAVPLSARAT